MSEENNEKDIDKEEIEDSEELETETNKFGEVQYLFDL